VRTSGTSNGLMVRTVVHVRVKAGVNLVHHVRAVRSGVGRSSTVGVVGTAGKSAGSRSSTSVSSTVI
jgi:hypothetical protein